MFLTECLPDHIQSDVGLSNEPIKELIAILKN